MIGLCRPSGAPHYYDIILRGLAAPDYRRLIEAGTPEDIVAYVNSTTLIPDEPSDLAWAKVSLAKKSPGYLAKQLVAHGATKHSSDTEIRTAMSRARLEHWNAFVQEVRDTDWAAYRARSDDYTAMVEALGFNDDSSIKPRYFPDTVGINCYNGLWGLRLNYAMGLILVPFADKPGKPLRGSELTAEFGMQWGQAVAIIDRLDPSKKSD